MKNIVKWRSYWAFIDTLFSLVRISEPFVWNLLKQTYLEYRIKWAIHTSDKKRFIRKIKQVKKTNKISSISLESYMCKQKNVDLVYSMLYSIQKFVLNYYEKDFEIDESDRLPTVCYHKNVGHCKHNVAGVEVKSILFGDQE